MDDAGPPPEDGLRAAARAWIAADPDPATRAELGRVLDSGDRSRLEDLVGRGLSFGTAGLRGPMGPGPNRMNRLTVRRAAAGMARCLLAEQPDACERGVVIGHDARHGSAAFAADAAQVVAAHGIPVHAVRGPAPTPYVVHVLDHLGAAAGLVVTASHNPATDNGLKVYWSDGAQIAPPVDTRIAAAIAAVPLDALVPAELPAGTVAGAVLTVEGPGEDGELVASYLARARSLVPDTPARGIRVAVTSLHGVGAVLLERALDAAGHHDVHPVPRQRHPDPDFPTVAFPNPEEPHALDALFELAAAVGADLALANDPDADRLALGAPDRDGRWRMLTGDETGWLLAHHLLGRTGSRADRLLATTVVSSRLLGHLAREADAHFAETLTGFKWLCRPGLAHPDWEQVLIYEEALGYGVGPWARDKDGITAALVATDLVAALAAEGRTVHDVLDDLAIRFGAHVTANGSLRVDGPGWRERLASLVEAVVTSPPEALGGVAVARTERTAPDVLRMWLADDTRVVIRPSGTEPKLKYYCEAVVAVVGAPESARAEGRRRLSGVVEAVRALVTT